MSIPSPGRSTRTEQRAALRSLRLLRSELRALQTAADLTRRYSLHLEGAPERRRFELQDMSIALVVPCIICESLTRISAPIGSDLTPCSGLCSTCGRRPDLEVSDVDHLLAVLTERF